MSQRSTGRGRSIRKEAKAQQPAPKKKKRKVRGTRKREGRSRGDGLRTCVGCNEATVAGELLRLVAGPDAVVHVDLRQKAPGRGCYLHPLPSCLAEAIKRRRIGRSLRREGLHLEASAIMAEAQKGATEQVGRLLSVGQKAGRVVSGAETVHRALSKGVLSFLIVASDASPQTVERVSGWGHAAGAAVYQLTQTVEELGRLVGKAPRAVIGLRAGDISRSLEREILRAQGLETGVVLMS